MDSLDNVLQQMDLAFVGSARHKITVEQLFAADDAVLLDVRSAEEVATLPLPFAHHKLVSINIPLHTLPECCEQVPRAGVVGIFCPHSVRAAVAYTYLRSKGYDNVRVLEGGYAAICDMARPGVVLAQIK